MAFKLGYQIQEQLYYPQVMLERVKLMEKAGLDIIWVPDHFHPWFHTGAQDAQAWVFMGAAAARTDKLSIGTAVTTPTFRYDPAMVLFKKSMRISRKASPFTRFREDGFINTENRACLVDVVL